MSEYYGEYEEDYNNEEVDSYATEEKPIEIGFNQIPDLVQDFLRLLQKALNDRNVNEIQNLYENSFIKLSDNYFPSNPWPEESEVEQVVTGSDHIFTILYKELYYRHIYAKCQPTIEHRFDSYNNYCHLFNHILSAESPVPLELPNQWLWDIIDEFIYQFQSFIIFRERVQKLSDIEVKQLKDSPKVWSVLSVLNVLHSLIDKSYINEQLQEFNKGDDPTRIADRFGCKALYKMLGYFSLIGLLRLHSLLGDYYQSIKVLENIDLNRQQIHILSTAPVLACQTTTFYYMGFAYIMMRRYSDAIRTFTNILIYLQRTRPFSHEYQTFQTDLIDKQTERMYKLLSICLALYPQKIDQSVWAQLTQSMSISMNKLVRGDLKEFETVFRQSCPKFLSITAGILENSLVPKTLAWKHHLNVFLGEVAQQCPVLEIRSYLKLYKTISMKKLSTFVEQSEQDLNHNLLCFKHKMQNMVWTKGQSGLEGQFQSGADMDFYIKADMIHIIDTKVCRRYGDWFLREIYKFDKIYRYINSIDINK